MGSPARREPEAAGVQEADNFGMEWVEGVRPFNSSAKRKKQQRPYTFHEILVIV